MTSKILLRAVLVIIFVVLGMLVFAYLKSSVPTTEPVHFAAPASGPAADAVGPLLPLPGSVAIAADTKHTIALAEVKRGCHTKDCVLPINSPEFVPATQLRDVLASSSLGIMFKHNQEVIFYPFPMLESRVVVNDVVAGDPVLVTYDALSGAGIVYQRQIGGVEVEFGISGLLWQSNVLLYNRAATIAEQNLWSQLLGSAVVGSSSGQRLIVLPSDTISYGTWLENHPAGKTLTTGQPTNLYQQQYWTAAQQFAPDFVAADSAVQPEEYVYGISIGDASKAYPQQALTVGETIDELAGQEIVITKTKEGIVSFVTTVEGGQPARLPKVTVFWFAWQAVHPQTLIWNNK